METIDATPQLSEFAKVLKSGGLHQAFLDRSITLFVPTNDAMRTYHGKRDENLALNHMVNVAILAHQLEESLVSLVTGSPPLWVRWRRTPSGRTSAYINEAQITQADIKCKSSGRGYRQVLHVIDSVLEPLVPISVQQSANLLNLDAQQLLSKSTLFELSGYRLRVFHEQAELNQRVHMFGTRGKHTFFIPVDAGFDVSVQLTGYNYERNQEPQSPTTPRIRKELVDASVIEGHIVPHQLMFTSFAPTQEFPTVAWLPDGIKVNVSLQPASFQSSNDPSILYWEGQQKDHQSFVYNKYPAEDNPEDPNYNPNNFLKPVMVRSNTIKGDRVHPRGMVVARILKGNIPVSNGVVHLIDKPLMIVAKSLYEYIMEEGNQPGNRLSKFARLLRDKGGLFAEAVLEAKDGTLLAPSNQALEKVDLERLNYILGNDFLRAEMLGLHFVRERVASNEFKIQAEGDQTYSVPASLATNRVWFNYNPQDQRMTVAGRGINATVIEKDIGTVNGVIHVIDRVLGVPYQSIRERLSTDPAMSHIWSLLKQTRLDYLFSDDFSAQGAKFTFVVPSNSAWEKAQQTFSKAYNTFTEGSFPHYTVSILQRHIKDGPRAFTFEELVEMTRSHPRRQVNMMTGSLEFTQLGQFGKLNAYKDNFVTMTTSQGKVQAKAIRPNIECTNGYIHLIDTVMIDDAPPWTVGLSSKTTPPLVAIYIAITMFLTKIN